VRILEADERGEGSCRVLAKRFGARWSMWRGYEAGWRERIRNNDLVFYTEAYLRSVSVRLTN
jgi:hypothetical protein